MRSSPRAAARPPVLLALLPLALAAGPAEGQDREVLEVPGLQEPVEILRDQWGIPHIYAETEYDLFFAQGYNAARDRIFQLEMWRREATGTLAEVFGPRKLEADRASRLFAFRGDMEEEMRHYHPRGHEIIPAFVDGINAYVDEVRTNPDDLPIEFELLGLEPGHWTPEVVVSRHQGLLGNSGSQLAIGRAVHLLGPERVKELEDFHPHDPGDLALEDPVDGEHLLEHDILDLYWEYRGGVDFEPRDIQVAEHRNDPDDHRRLAERLERERPNPRDLDREAVGSNNWVISGERAQNDHPMMANDPHRAHQAPALRYWVHLNGPGWDVVGGGEPAIPGVSIGHNGYGAWGLTVFRIDHEDIFVYETHPDDPERYRYDGRWEEMEVLEDTVAVAGEGREAVELKYARHGPVVYEDPDAGLAYGLGAAWMEVGGAPYLASLRMNQAESWEEFRDAVTYNHTPGENMVWADEDGNIGWQPGGIAPVRRDFSGLVPVPGDGRYEWDGFLPIEDLPGLENPPEGYFATANANVTSPFDYEHLDEAIYFLWADPFRQDRVNEVLNAGHRFNQQDMVELQHDYVSIPARTLTPLLGPLEGRSAQGEKARRLLVEWDDHDLAPGSVEAAIYVAWERKLRSRIQDLFIPSEAQSHISLGLKRTIDMLMAPPAEFMTLGGDVVEGRDAFLLEALEDAVAELQERLGPDMARWRYGQEDYKHALLRHPLSTVVDEGLRDDLDVGPVPRGGYGNTVGNTGGGDNQTSGASFRIFVDTSDWDATLGMTAPGQAGDPESPFYDNAFPLWADDRVFPVFYSRHRVEGVTERRLELRPVHD